MAVRGVGVAGGFGGALMESVDFNGGELGGHGEMSVKGGGGQSKGGRGGCRAAARDSS
jgi:hypothetical protein